MITEPSEKLGSKIFSRNFKKPIYILEKLM